MSNPVSRELSLMLSGYGYNLYNDRNRMRADDLLVRQQAAGALADAANALRTLRTEYRRRFVPPPTREQPEPPRDRLDQLSAMTRLQDRLAELETRVRSMPVPPTDTVWERFRREQTLLAELLTHDYNLVTPCREVRDAAQALSAGTWTADSAAALDTLDRLAGRIEQAIRARALFLQV